MYVDDKQRRRRLRRKKPFSSGFVELRDSFVYLNVKEKIHIQMFLITQPFHIKLVFILSFYTSQPECVHRGLTILEL